MTVKYDSPSSPETSYFGKLESFLNIASQSVSEHYNSRPDIEFDETLFEGKVIKSFITKLIGEIEVSFGIPEHLKRFKAMDLTMKRKRLLHWPTFMDIHLLENHNLLIQDRLIG